MQNQEFDKPLVLATQKAKGFALDYVYNVLPVEDIYNVHLSASADSADLKQFDIYPKDNGKIIKRVKRPSVIQALCRNGKIPVWIDISVLEIYDGKTCLQLFCSGRYSDDRMEFYYRDTGLGPFGIKSPNLKIDHKENEKFWLKETKK